jgi:uncharacterized protein YraI
MLRILVACAIVLGALMVWQPIKPVSAHTGTYRVNAGNGLNLRTGPGGSYRRLYTMPDGTLVKARGHRGNWMYLTDLSTGSTGWAWLDFLEKVSAGGSSGGLGSGGPSGGLCMTNYWAEYVCASANVANAIRYWAGQYGIGAYWLFATAACESSFNPGAYNPISGVSGLFQFQPTTFFWQGGVSLWDVWDQSRIAAKMFAAGLARHFYCAVLVGYA